MNFGALTVNSAPRFIMKKNRRNNIQSVRNMINKTYPGNRDQRRTIEAWKIAPKPVWKSFDEILDTVNTFYGGKDPCMYKEWLTNALHDLVLGEWLRPGGTGLYRTTEKGEKYLASLPDECFK